MTWKALILAGSRGATDPVAESAGVTDKAMALIAGRPMLHHVIDALRAVDQIADIAVCGGTALDIPAGVTALPAEPTPAQSVQSGLARLGTPLLVTTADNPLLRSKTAAQFLDGATRSGGNAVAGVAPRAVVEAAGNTARRTYLGFRDGAVSGCNLFAFTAPESAKAAAFWRRLETERKRPWRMALSIGPGILLRYLAGQLDQTTAAEAISRRAGCRAAMVTLDDPFAAHDVDKPADLIFAEQVMQARLQP